MFALIPWAFAASNLKRDLGLVWQWLCHRSFWQLVSLGLAIALLVDHLALLASHQHAAKVEAQLSKAIQELRAISTKRNEQKVETEKRIVVVREKIRHADDEARKIEQAPLPGQCRTPDAVLQADL